MPDRALDLNLAAQHVAKTLADCESKTCVAITVAGDGLVDLLEFFEYPSFTHSSVSPGVCIPGPAVIVETETATVVPPSFTAQVSIPNGLQTMCAMDWSAEKQPSAITAWFSSPTVVWTPMRRRV